MTICFQHLNQKRLPPLVLDSNLGVRVHTCQLLSNFQQTVATLRQGPVYVLQLLTNADAHIVDGVTYKVTMEVEGSQNTIMRSVRELLTVFRSTQRERTIVPIVCVYTLKVEVH